MEKEDKPNALHPIWRIGVLLLITIGAHMLSATVYAALHSTDSKTVGVVTEGVIAFSLLALWIGYTPSKRVWLKIILAMVALVSHWLLMPTY